MTWTTPQPTPTPGAAPLVQPGPLSLGDIAGGAWRIYRARFGLFLKLLVMPFLIMFGVTLAFVLVFAAIVAANPRGVQQATPALVALGIGFYVAMMVVSLLLYVYQGRSVIAGLDLATGRQEPTGPSLADRTRGMLGRVFILMLVFAGLGLALGVAMIAVFVPLAMATASGSDNSSGAGAAGLLGLLVVLALYVGLIWFGIKTTYVIPAMAEERLDAIPSIRRSFQLTKGAFWKTFGYQIVLGLIMAAIILIPYIIAVTSIVAGATARGEAASGGAIAGMLFGMALMYAAMLLLVPYSYLYTALMYLGRTREVAGPVAAQQYAPQGQYPTQGQQYPTQGQQYPPQGQQYPQNPWDAPPAGGSTPQG